MRVEQSHSEEAIAEIHRDVRANLRGRMARKEIMSGANGAIAFGRGDRINPPNARA